MSVELIAKKTMGRVRTGDVFSAPRAHAKVLVALGHAKVPPPKVEKAPRQYKRRDMVAEPATQAPPAAPAPVTTPEAPMSPWPSVHDVPAMTTANPAQST